MSVCWSISHVLYTDRETALLFGSVQHLDRVSDDSNIGTTHAFRTVSSWLFQDWSALRWRYRTRHSWPACAPGRLPLEYRAYFPACRAPFSQTAVLRELVFMISAGLERHLSARVPYVSLFLRLDNVCVYHTHLRPCYNKCVYAWVRAYLSVCVCICMCMRMWVYQIILIVVICSFCN